MITGGGDESFEPKQPSLWRNRDYTLLLSGQAISRIGTQVSQTASPLLVLALTGSAGWASLVFGMVLVPNLVLSLPAGVLVDRWNRKTVMIVCDMGRALALGSIPVALALGRLSILQLCLAALLEGTGATFFTVAEGASLPELVDDAQLEEATGQQQAVNTVAFVVGPALAGLLLSVGRLVPFLVDALSYGASVLSLLFIKRSFQEEHAAPAPQSLLADIREGLLWLWRDAVVRLFVILAGIGSGIDNVLVLLFLVLATQRLHASASVTGVALGIAAGGGGIVGALLAASATRRLGLVRLLLLFSWARVVLIPLLLLAPTLVLLSAILFIDTVVVVAQGAALYATRQRLIPAEIRGRIGGVYMLVVLSTPLVAIWGIGAAFQWLGLFWTVLILTTCAAAAALLVSMNRAIRALPTTSPRKPVQKEQTQEGATDEAGVE